MILSIRLLIVPLCICAGVQEAAAQKLAYRGIAWGIPVDSVRGPLRALGFAFRSEMDGGDLQFAREDGALLHAEASRGRLIGITLIDPARGERVNERFHALADSLRAELGAPDESTDEGTQPMRLWEAGRWSVRVQISRATGERAAQVAWRGPGWFDEMDRRGDRPRLPAGFSTVTLTPSYGLRSTPRSAARARRVRCGAAFASSTFSRSRRCWTAWRRTRWTPWSTRWSSTAPPAARA
jgi:hypothetical protein